jgi:hypothetical protein
MERMRAVIKIQDEKIYDLDVGNGNYKLVGREGRADT